MPQRDSIDVANAILRTAQDKGVSMSMMKLLKLVYFAHGWTLALTGKPLCSDNAEAWQYGPVFRLLYNSLPYKGSQEVAFPVKNIFAGNQEGMASFSSDEESIINKVIDVYGKLGAFQLSNLTHEANSSWDVTQRKRGFFSEIDNDLIRADFERQLAKEAA